MSPSTVLVINEASVFHQVVMHTLTRACTNVTFLEAHSLDEAQSPLLTVTLSAVVSTDQLLDATPVDVVRLVRLRNQSTPVFFLTPDRRMVELGVTGAAGVYVFPAGLGELVTALQRLA